MKTDRNTRLALELLAEGGLTVAAVVPGGRHTVVKLVGGGRVIVSRGASQGEHAAWIVKRDVGRIVRAREVTR